MKKLKVLEGNIVKVFGHEFELEFPKLSDEEIYEKVALGMTMELEGITETEAKAKQEPKKTKKK